VNDSFSDSTSQVLTHAVIFHCLDVYEAGFLQTAIV